MTTPEDVTTDESIESEADRALDEIEAALAAIEQSIAGFDDGSYGRCEICGESVGAERLEARATERRCVTHAHA
jgi:RNA polymerase-binding transcription factor DksA